MKIRFNTSTVGKINLVQFINHGGEAAVWLVETADKRRKQFALKVYNENRRNNFKKELKVKELLKKHNNVLLPIEHINDTK